MVEVVGIKDMHPTQVKELMDFCCFALDTAESLSELLGSSYPSEEMDSRVESLIEIFGGNTLILRTSHESSGSEPE